MSNHDIDELFDLELAAIRAGLPPAHETHGRIITNADRSYLEGICAAIERNPTPEEARQHDLIARCTIDEDGRVNLPPDAPPDLPAPMVDRIKLIALLRRGLDKQRGSRGGSART